MRINIEKNQCTGCTACYNICPQKCIELVRDAEGFLYPEINESKCVQCNLCNIICPINKELSKDDKTKAFAVINENEKTRMNSSSGGFFSLVAEYVLEREGAVYGAAYDEEFIVKHICIESKKELNRLRSAKYSQSELNKTFEDVKKRLNNNQLVLFSGTPCQVGGLKAYLKKDYDNLLTIDLICHGVPSPLVWKKYVKERLKGRKLKSINLRSKATGWSKYGYSTEFVYENGEHELIKQGLDPFMQAFVYDICLRPSCYECQYKGINRISDFTLGDYWGVWEQHPEMDDDKGTSLLLLHSDKGKKIFEELDNIRYKKVDLEEGIKNNPSTIKSAKEHESRKEFFMKMGKKSLDVLVKKYIWKEKSRFERIVSRFK